MKNMTLHELYEAVGGDMRDVAERLGDLETVESFVLLFPDDPSCPMLLNSLRKNDLERAFHAAHSLKGVCGNLGFKRLGDCASDVCEKLRGGELPPESLLQQLKKEYCLVITAIERFKKGS